MIHILTLIIMYNTHMVTITNEYNSLEACVAASNANRDNLKYGNVILNTCTKK